MQLLLQTIPIVVADFGKPLHWVRWSEYWDFWKNEVTPHLTSLEDWTDGKFLGDFCFIASEWTTTGEGPVILLEKYYANKSRLVEEKFSSLPPVIRDKIEIKDFSEIDREFHLGLYRYAVRRYQPIIEQRTGVSLGDIQVKDASELHHDIAVNVERNSTKGLFGFLRRKRFKRLAKATADASIGGIPPTSLAFYTLQSIYVAFTMGMQTHEDWVVQGTVHELAHRLWEKLGGQFPNIRWQKERSMWKLKMACEGYSVYAERIWFRDSYPPLLRKRLASEYIDESSVQIKGMRVMEKLVDRMGPQILLKVPTEWQKLISSNDYRL